MELIKEFQEFFKEYKVIRLAIAFMIGSATTDLVQSLVNDVIIPVLTPLLAPGSLETIKLKVGPVVIKMGSFLSALLNFVILLFVVFIIAKKILKEERT